MNFKKLGYIKKIQYSIIYKKVMKKIAQKKLKKVTSISWINYQQYWCSKNEEEKIKQNQSLKIVEYWLINKKFPSIIT